MDLFKTLQVPEVQRYWIRQARVPTCSPPGGPKTAVDRDGATLVDLLVDNERIAAIEPAGVAAPVDLPAIDLEAHYVWPTLIDMHAHLDKGHIVTRTENPDGSFAGALQSTAEDRTDYWTAGDMQTAYGIRIALRVCPRCRRDPHASSILTGHGRTKRSAAGQCFASSAGRVGGPHPAAGRRVGADRRVPNPLRRGTRRSRDRFRRHSRCRNARCRSAFTARLLDDLDPLLDTVRSRSPQQRGLDVDLHVDESG